MKYFFFKFKFIFYEKTATSPWKSSPHLYQQPPQQKGGGAHYGIYPQKGQPYLGEQPELWQDCKIRSKCLNIFENVGAKLEKHSICCNFNYFIQKVEKLTTLASTVPTISVTQHPIICQEFFNKKLWL